MYMWHCWDFSAPPAVIWRPGNCAPLAPLVTRLALLHPFAMIQTCTYLYSSDFTTQVCQKSLVYSNALNEVWLKDLQQN